MAGLCDVEEKVVPSKSDVLDILNIASFGVNQVNSDNLKEVSGRVKWIAGFYFDIARA